MRNLGEAAAWILAQEQSMTAAVDSLRVKIFADGADRARVEALCAEPWIQGFTTNPTLMRAAGVDDYPTFAQRAARARARTGRSRSR